jgi:hypothetical protein
MLEVPRRRFLTGLVGLLAAPALVKASSLMPIKVQPLVPVPKTFLFRVTYENGLALWENLTTQQSISSPFPYPPDQEGVSWFTTVRLHHGNA